MAKLLVVDDDPVFCLQYPRHCARKVTRCRLLAGVQRQWSVLRKRFRI